MRILCSWRRAALVVALVGGALVLGTSRQSLVAQEPGIHGELPVTPRIQERADLAEAVSPFSSVSKPADNRLSTALNQVQAVGQSRRGGAFDGPVNSLPALVAGGAQAGTLNIDQGGAVQVYIEVEGDVAPVIAALASRGHTVENSNQDLQLVQARVPAASLAEVSTLPGVTFVREPDYGQLNAGSVTTQGDAILGGAALRSAFGTNGAGVRVGVISSGLEGLTAAQASGDLPAVNVVTCDVIESAAVGEPSSPTDAGAGAEGTAMLEIVHDIAPGAELWFGYFGFGNSSGTTLDFLDAVDCLAANTDIVVDDIAFFNAGPYDGTSAISVNASTELNRVTNPIRGYYNAVGNSARGHYQENFLNSGFVIEGGTTDWTIHEFAASGSTTDAGFAYPCSALPADGACGNTLVLAPNGFASVRLQWNDPWGASQSDYDLLLIDESVDPAVVYVASGNTQNGNDNPVEAFGWLNTTGADQIIDVVIAKFGVAVTRNFDMFVSCSGCYLLGPNSDVHNFNTQSSSVANNSDAGGGVVTLGAINQADPGNDAIESFSSRGPTNNGTIKPDASAIDGVAITGAAGFPNPFFGTSAAAPHAAAIAALVLSCNPSLLAGEAGDNPGADRTNLRNALLNSAVDLGAVGNDTTFGKGRLNASAAATAAGCTTDGDGDGVLNAADNCPTLPNATQTNTDSAPIVTPGAVDDTTVARSDLQGDLCDADDDNDGVLDSAEAGGCNGSGALNALLFDSDGDRVGDGAECALGTNPGDANSRPLAALSVALDPDRDGLDAAREAALGSSPNDADSDGDGISDGIEYRSYNTSPSSANSDGDVCDDDIEIASVNGDLRVNATDLTLVAQRFRQPGIPNMDINKDGNINAIDLSLVAQNFQSLDC